MQEQALDSHPYSPQAYDALFELSPQLADKVERLGLAEVISSLKQNGYGVIQNAAPLEFFEQLRDAILRVNEIGKSAIVGGGGNMWLPGKEVVIDQSLINPKVLAVVEVMCGKGAILSQTLTTIIERDDTFLAQLHADQGWFSEPFPLHNQFVTFCWVTDGYTEEGGATQVVPGSHLRRRQPTPAEFDTETTPIECPAGSIVVWDGSVWHKGAPRLTEGKRVVCHNSYSRLSARPLESYDDLSDNWLQEQPYEMRVLLGREDVLARTETEGLDCEDPGENTNQLFFKTHLWSKGIDPDAPDC